MWTLNAMIWSTVFLVALLFVTMFWHWFDLRWWMLTGAATAMTLGITVVPSWRYHVHRWEVTDNAVYTQTGWWTVEQRIAPISRIQTVDYAEDALSKLFGLAKVTVTTASAAGALEIAGLAKAEALALVDSLIMQADAVSGDAT
jgi:uncharacterized protein